MKRSLSSLYTLLRSIFEFFQEMPFDAVLALIFLAAVLCQTYYITELHK